MPKDPNVFIFTKWYVVSCILISRPRETPSTFHHMLFAFPSSISKNVARQVAFKPKNGCLHIKALKGNSGSITFWMHGREGQMLHSRDPLHNAHTLRISSVGSHSWAPVPCSRGLLTRCGWKSPKRTHSPNPWQYIYHKAVLGVCIGTLYRSQNTGRRSSTHRSSCENHQALLGRPRMKPEYKGMKQISKHKCIHYKLSKSSQILDVIYRPF